MEGTLITTAHCGQAVVTKYHNKDKIEVRFVATGHTLTTSKRRLTLKGKPRLRDPLYPSVFGVGRIGIGRHRAHHKGRDTKPYSIWRAMLRRCYYDKERKPWRDAVVCNEWLCFQTFADWYEAHHPQDGKPYQLDKDIKGNSTLYSPENCQFVTQQENLAARTRGRFS